LFLSSDFGPFLEDEIDFLLTGFGCEFFGFLERFVWSWDAVFESNFLDLVQKLEIQSILWIRNLFLPLRCLVDPFNAKTVKTVG
jgi:hypothetical protein